MKKNYFKNTIKFGVAAILMMAIGNVNAQSADGNTAKTEQTASDGPTIKVIDNKGTIKYLQSNNGITAITNTTTDVTTTTFQLGGTLDESTYIDATGQVFALDGLEFATTASTNATTGSTHITATGTGYALLVRDEATGATQKLLVSDLLSSAYKSDTYAGNGNSNDFDVLVTLPTADEKIWVYRNGAKLVKGTDFTVSGTEVTLDPTTGGWPAIGTDVIEIHVLSF